MIPGQVKNPNQPTIQRNSYRKAVEALIYFKIIMEYERALYRVYERCLEGLRDNSPSDIGTRTCKMCEYISLSCAVTFFGCLLFLHLGYVGNSGCLYSLLQERATGYNISDFNLRDDQILQIKLDKKSSLQTDESGSDSLRNSNNINSEGILENFISHANNKTADSSAKLFLNSINGSEYDYEFSMNYLLLSLSPELRRSHNFEVINITYAGTRCFGSKFSQLFLPLGGIDTVILNNLMYTFRKPGYLKTKSDDFYSWDKRDIVPYENIGGWISFKLSILVTSLFAFFLLSATTALLVRVLISSGVVLLFPFFWIIQVNSCE